MLGKDIVPKACQQLLVFLSLCVWSAVALEEMLEQPIRHPDCPLFDDPLHPLQLPNPTDCRKYYICKNGYAYPMYCEDGFLWSIQTYHCDYPTKAKCVGTIPNEFYPTSITDGGAFPISEKIIYKQDATDCNKLYKCVPMRCPSYLYWNSVLEQCDSPQTAICENPTYIWPQTPYITDMIPTEAARPSIPKAELGPASQYSINDIEQSELRALCRTPGVDYVRHPFDCHKFIQCDGFASVHTCGNGLLWNSEVMACDRYCK
ncbi:probable chitinase 10 [Ceratitis capitata]|uniref:probable chitinase 10 n=1 Tax=Ceratitis capitata TaxID=7213 RepID=UPI000329C8AB|nr:probable chitinase 10 [Ceratitis capitata]XP_020716359.1 probable chitinase 10 [Ceratitis capitata]